MAAFSTEEDVALIRAFYVVASEPLIGREMEGRVFWNRILEEFRASFGNNIERSTKSIQCRFTILKQNVKRYVGHVRVRCRGMAAGGYNVATAYHLGQAAYEEEGKIWRHGAVFEILKTQFGREYDPEFFHPPFKGNPEDGAEA
ncbi:hypothetical protein C5167_013305 [Papaver somniferum]|uniref:Myb/SANT-like domain-containing protein n=1 Tax=Papaver somniferum TaxID=3469 RepID=A0A4Y7J463_PAPSO|nr:uncharacterized protein LOC113361344 [Papaver somniferum]RZC54445.1 hypothetical protein C5167_013305 [Papaver somniferum]